MGRNRGGRVGVPIKQLPLVVVYGDKRLGPELNVVDFLDRRRYIKSELARYRRETAFELIKAPKPLVGNVPLLVVYGVPNHVVGKF